MENFINNLPEKGYISKTIHVCPVDGIVTDSDDFTHKHELYITKTSVTFVNSIFFYMSSDIDVFVYKSTIPEFIRMVESYKEKIIGFKESLMIELPDSFI